MKNLIRYRSRSRSDSPRSNSNSNSSGPRDKKNVLEEAAVDSGHLLEKAKVSIGKFQSYRPGQLTFKVLEQHPNGLEPASPLNQNSDVSDDPEEEWQVKVDEFNMRQAILRTKLRVQNDREEPIDFIAKVVLMIFGLIPLHPKFLTNEFKQSYKISPQCNAVFNQSNKKSALLP